MRPALRLAVVAVFAIMASVHAAPRQASGPVAAQSPRVIVLLVVDQLRADYVDRYGARWTGGLRRLLDHGAYFRQARYPYAATETCPGHTTIATGTFPATHGVIANGWYDRVSGRAVTCTADTARPVGIGASGVYESHGPHALRVPTLADELRAQQPGDPQIVTLSLKARAAIPLAGHAGSTVAWLEDSGGWSTSTAYTDHAPAAAAAFVRAHAVEADYGRIWQLLGPRASYAFVDDGVAEQAPDGWTTTFPHSLARPQGPDRVFYDNWRRTPFGDEYLGRMAAAVARGLGRGRHTDFLAVSFSGLDYVGHRFGPNSREVQDTLARLDLTIGQLLSALDASLGAGRYVVALTGDHGVAPIPEQQAAHGFDAGRVMAGDIQMAVERVLGKALGPGPYLMPGSADAGNKATDVYLTAAALAALSTQPVLRGEVLDAVKRVPGVARAIWADELADLRDAEANALRLSFDPSRNGDLLVVAKPYWVSDAGGTSHGTAYAYDQRVPLVLMGSRIRMGVIDTPATPADIAPTLAFLTGITLPRTDGSVLHQALR